MKIKEKEYGSKGGKEVIFILDNGFNLVAHEKGSNSINIRSTAPDYGSIPITGVESLKALRDALIDVCLRQGID
jgi:hypothetical protein